MNKIKFEFWWLVEAGLWRCEVWCRDAAWWLMHQRRKAQTRAIHPYRVR